ncbi:glucose 1-dehydrogenase [Geobacter sp. DSM 9736]|uniref:glucose 1-dehydrogenase n=1 Tax=Geobacter sp. DSM 9736 TaxID=1277350 RepID=UPI000B5010F6|nr:glucose 1-dehydrogenase [Geobacter sp. DSM 9736]SNB47132.1 Threonine dehydrogenase [Geobacter sp. DSM 9736]
MKAVAVFPGRKNSVHLRDVERPSLSSNRQVLVKVLQVGLDGTDREIISALYGNPPPGDDYLIFGHESLGVVEAVASDVDEFAPGDYVVATVRRPGGSVYDALGMYDMTTDDDYRERGINLLHGYLVEYYVEAPEFLVKVPSGLKHVGVLLEPAGVIEKGVGQAYEIQRRMRVWRPARAAVLGAGSIGLLATMALRLRGLQVCTFGLQRPPYYNSDLIHALGGRYFSTEDVSLEEASREHGPFDIIFEATGYSPVAFEAMNILGKNGVLILASLTAGGRTVTVPADRINRGIVLGNKVVVGTVNAGRGDFEAGVKDLAQCELQWPGWLSRLLTHRIEGLEKFERITQLFAAGEAVKLVVEVSKMTGQDGGHGISSN